MSRKVIKTADGEGFLRAMWDSLADVQEVYEVDILFTVERTKRRGVFKYRLAALGREDVPESVLRAVYIGEYPSSQVATLEAFLYRCALKLEHILEMQKRYPEGKA